MPRRRHPAHLAVVASTAVLTTFTFASFALAGCGSPWPHTIAAPHSAPVSISPSASEIGGSAVPSPTPSTPRPSTPTKGGSSPSTPGIAAKPHAVKLTPWPHAKGMLNWHGPVGSMGSTGTSGVALTFDDGPGPYTSSVLDLLDKYHVKATFCLIGRQMTSYRAVIKRMVADGMTLCNHSWNHDESLGRKSTATIASNLDEEIDTLHKIDPHAQMDYFRHPGGNFTQAAVSVCEQLGMRPLYWSVDTQDWTRPGVPAIVKSLTDDVRPGSIVLMHDAGGDRSETLAALRIMLPKLAKKFHLVALSTARTATVTPPPLPTPKPKPKPKPAPHPSPSPSYPDTPAIDPRH